MERAQKAHKIMKPGKKKRKKGKEEESEESDKGEKKERKWNPQTEFSKPIFRPFDIFREGDEIASGSYLGGCPSKSRKFGRKEFGQSAEFRVGVMSNFPHFSSRFRPVQFACCLCWPGFARFVRLEQQKWREKREKGNKKERKTQKALEFERGFGQRHLACKEEIF